MRTYGTLRLLATKWVIEELEPHAAIKIKALFAKIPKARPVPFYLDNTPEVCNDLDWFMVRYPLKMSDYDYAALRTSREQHLQKQEFLEKILAPGYVPSPIHLELPLRGYQSQAIDLYRANNRLLVGDDVGLGKTAIGIGSFTFSDMLPAAVVVQTHMPTQWREQIHKFMPFCRVHLVKHRTPSVLPMADVYIFKYSTLSGWVDTFKTAGFKSVIFDEVQELRRSGSDKYEAGEELAKNVERVIGLSATPIYNFGEEIYNILEVIKPGCLGARDDFYREWGGDVIQHPKALGTYLRENHLFLRRTRKDVEMELPPVNKIVHTVEYDEKKVQTIEALARQLAIKVTTGSFTERGQAARELDIMVRHNTGVAKAKAVADYVRILLENEEPVLLAGWHRDVYDIWNEELKDFKPVMYTGSETGPQKDAAKKAFMNGDTNLMMISLRSGVGLDGLQDRCSIAVFGELDWSPGVHQQMLGRLHRFGQPNQVTAIYLISDSGSDPLMVDLLGLKSSQAQDIIDPLSLVQEQQSDVSRIALLAERFLQKRGKSE